MPSSSSSRDFRTRASNCALLTITVLCICILVLCGVMIVREYALAKEYEPATCTIHNITYTGTVKCRFCNTKEKGKSKEKGALACRYSYFPCLQVQVSYVVKNVHMMGKLHPDSLQANGANAQCSYEVCLKREEDNKKAVEEYAKEYRRRRQESFQCYYNTEDSDKLIANKRHTKTEIIHSMFWPSLVIVICGIIFLRLETQRRGVGFCGNPDTQPGGAHYGQAAGNMHNGKQTVIKANQEGESKVELLSKQGTHAQSKHPTYLSNSLSSLDRISKQPHHQKQRTHDARITPSKSVDGLQKDKQHRHDQTTSKQNGKDTHHLMPQNETSRHSYNFDAEEPEEHHVGMETPV